MLTNVVVRSARGMITRGSSRAAPRARAAPPVSGSPMSTTRTSSSGGATERFKGRRVAIFPLVAQSPERRTSAASGTAPSVAAASARGGPRALFAEAQPRDDLGTTRRAAAVRAAGARPRARPRARHAIVRWLPLTVSVASDTLHASAPARHAAPSSPIRLCARSRSRARAWPPSGRARARARAPSAISLNAARRAASRSATASSAAPPSASWLRPRSASSADGADARARRRGRRRRSASASAIAPASVAPLRPGAGARRGRARRRDERAGERPRPRSPRCSTAQHRLTDAPKSSAGTPTPAPDAVAGGRPPSASRRRSAAARDLAKRRRGVEPRRRCHCDQPHRRRGARGRSPRGRRRRDDDGRHRSAAAHALPLEVRATPSSRPPHCAAPPAAVAS